MVADRECEGEAEFDADRDMDDDFVMLAVHDDDLLGVNDEEQLPD